MNSNKINRVLRNIVNDYNLEETAIALFNKREPELIPQITCHHLRHTFCTRVIENGVNIKTVQYWMGHHYVGTTIKIYLSISDSKNKDEMSKIEGKIKLT